VLAGCAEMQRPDNRANACAPRWFLEDAAFLYVAGLRQTRDCGGNGAGFSRCKGTGQSGARAPVNPIDVTQAAVCVSDTIAAGHFLEAPRRREAFTDGAGSAHGSEHDAFEAVLGPLVRLANVARDHLRILVAGMLLNAIADSRKLLQMLKADG
jgi:hypothetical protein